MRLPACQLDSVGGNVAARDSTGEEPRLGLFQTPPVAEDVQQPGGEHDVAIFLPLAEFDADDHALAIDMGGVAGGRPRRCAIRRRNTWSEGCGAWGWARNSESARPPRG